MLKPPDFKGVLPMSVNESWTPEVPLELSAYLVHRCLHASVNWSFAEVREVWRLHYANSLSSSLAASGVAICAWLARGRQTQHWWCFSPFEKRDKWSLIKKEETRSHLGYNSQGTLHRKEINIFADELFRERKQSKGFLDGYFPEIRSDLISCIINCLIA